MERPASLSWSQISSTRLHAPPTLLPGLHLVILERATHFLASGLLDHHPCVRSQAYNIDQPNVSTDHDPYYPPRRPLREFTAPRPTSACDSTRAWQHAGTLLKQYCFLIYTSTLPAHGRLSSIFRIDDSPDAEHTFGVASETFHLPKHAQTGPIYMAWRGHLKKAPTPEYPLLDSIYHRALEPWNGFSPPRRHAVKLDRSLGGFAGQMKEIHHLLGGFVL